jgi:hypothetical protein
MGVRDQRDAAALPIRTGARIADIDFDFSRGTVE